MESIQALLKKLEDLNSQEQHTAIDLDLMLQYTRDIYDLLLVLRATPLQTAPPAPIQEDTIAVSPYTAPTIELKTPEEDSSTIVPMAEEPIQPGENTIPGRVTNTYTAPLIELNIQEDSTVAPAEETIVEEKTQTILQPIFFNDVPNSAKDIRKSIGINDKYQIMSELFGNNKENYETVMSELNSFQDYPEAQTWLKAHLANAPGWDEEGYTVQLLYGLMQRFFA